MKILITTGIYPPKIGGPAQYAKSLKETLEKQGHAVSVKTFLIENSLPTGVRHIFFFFKILPAVISSDTVIILDTFSVGFPTVLATNLFGKKSIIRTGGDFLWEGFVERTGKKVLLSKFYREEKANLSTQEKIVFNLTKWALHNASRVVFSTEWQRDIFVFAYGLKLEATSIIENYYGPKEDDSEASTKVFVGSTRELKWKNLDVLKKVFQSVKAKNSKVELFTENLPFERFMEKMKSAHAVILVSLGDISPNMILDAIRFNRPFICTREVGIFDRIKDAGIFVDPLNEEEIEGAIHELLDNETYKKAKDRVKAFSFEHSYENIGAEFIEISNNIK